MNKTTTRNNTSPFLWCDINKSWTEKKRKKKRETKSVEWIQKGKRKGKNCSTGVIFSHSVRTSTVLNDEATWRLIKVTSHRGGNESARNASGPRCFHLTGTRASSSRRKEERIYGSLKAMSSVEFHFSSYTVLSDWKFFIFPQSNSQNKILFY